jgi:hypothetical protein
MGGGGKLVFNRFTGPGRIALQSSYYRPPGEATGNSGKDTTGNLLNAVFGN